MTNDVLFRRLILVQLALIVILLPAALVDYRLASPEVDTLIEQVNAHNLLFSFNEEITAVDIVLIVFLLLYLLAYVSLYFFKWYGKPLLVLLFVSFEAIALFAGPEASYATEFVFNDLNMAVEGAILFMLFFTDTKDRFRRPNSL